MAIVTRFVSLKCDVLPYFLTFKNIHFRSPLIVHVVDVLRPHIVEIDQDRLSDGGRELMQEEMSTSGQLLWTKASAKSLTQLLSNIKLTTRNH